jgi:DNA-3-methyladenine glycosylase
LAIRLPRRFFARSALDVAPDLLHKVLTTGDASVRITETEAYLRDDPASHSFRGMTPRTRVMFGPPGHLYVYFTYGMHWCANVVTGLEGVGEAVLLRGGLPLTGLEAMRARRPAARRARDLTDGPAKLAQALGIDGELNGIDLLDPSATIRIMDDGTAPPAVITTTPRIGITKAVDQPWRFLVRPLAG